MAWLLGVNRKRIYFRSIKAPKDELVKKEIEEAHLIHPAYGHKRLALYLKYSTKKVLRIMHKYHIFPPRRKGKRYWTTVSTNNHSYTNLIKGVIPTKPNHIFATDLTYLKYQGKQFYLATVLDIFTREIVSAEMSDKHDSSLALLAIKRAVDLSKPEFFHSDQGTEFMAQAVTSFLERLNIKVSVSDKASPWQNGYKESFFGRFKDEIGDINRFSTLGELVEEIYSYIHYYNNLRIHTAIKTTPMAFKQSFQDAESVSRKQGT